MKLRAAADFTVDPDAAAMHLDDVLGDGETESGAAEFAGARGIHAVEAFENARLVGFGDADAGIRDGKYDFAIARLRTDDNLATRKRVLQAVFEHILHNLAPTRPAAG